MMVATLALASVSWAQAVDIATLPIEFTRAPATLKPADQDDLNAAFKRFARTAGTTMPPTAKLEKAWSELRRQDCATEDACLSQFAIKTGALYGLYTGVDTTVKGDVVALGRIVRDDGKAARAPVSVRVPKAPGVQWTAQVKQALEQLVKQLDPGTLPVTREVATRPPDALVSPLVDAGVPVVAVPSAVDAGVTLVPPPPPPLESPLKPIGIVTAVTGGALLVGGGALVLVGRGQAATVTGPDSAFTKDGTAAQANVGRSATTLQTVGTTLAAVGVAATAAGVVMWLMAPSEPAKMTMMVAPLPGGATLVLTGELP